MLASQRRDLILAEVARSGGVRVGELTARLGVSDMTVRRDLEHLERHGWLRKVHGGAVALGSSADEPGFEAKRLLEQPVKNAIAIRAARLVEPHAAIGISAGTTTWMLASHLKGVGPLSVVTNSTTVADALSARPTTDADASSGWPAGPDVTVILTGGVRTPSAALVGPVADRAIDALHVDRLFLGVHGMDAAGFTTPNLAEAQTNRSFVARARQVIVLADSTKWGTVGLADIGPLSVADVLITDDRLPEEARRIIEEQVGELILVPAGPDG